MSEKVRWRGGRFSALWPLKAVLFVMRMKGFCKMNVFFAVMRCDVNSDWKRMLLAIILDYCEGRECQHFGRKVENCAIFVRIN